MKLLNMGLLVILLSSSVAHAVNPIPGWYAGLIAGGSQAADIDLDVLVPINGHSGKGLLTYTVLGNVGGQLGYRKNQFRVEGEFFYNNNPYKHLQINGVNIPNVGSPATTVQQLSIQSRTPTNPFTFSGYTNTYALMFNGFYDFYIPEYTEHVVPYVGLGVGYEHVENNLTFFVEGSPTNNSVFSEFTNNFAGQAIAGLGYFLSDYMTFSFDFRYLSSTRTNTVGSRFTSFQSRPQLYSVNFIFNSAFNLA